MKARLLLALAIGVTMVWNSTGSTSPWWERPPGKIEAHFLTLEMFSLEEHATKPPPKVEEYERRKSVKKAFLLSAVLPGAGEYYAGSLWRTVLFGSAEILAWTGYFHWQNRGKDEEDKFRAFADEHWDIEKYKEWVNDEAHKPPPITLPPLPDSVIYGDGINDKEDWETIRDYLPSAFIHDVYDALNNDKQQYYEMIGKYYDRQFGSGWAYADESEDTLGPYWESEFAEYYEDLRYESNKLLDRARWGLGAALINRVLSAADAAWMVNSHNRRIDRFSDRFYGIKLRAGMMEYCGESVPQLIISRKF